MTKTVKWTLVGVGGCLALVGIAALAFMAFSFWIARESPGFEVAIVEARKAGASMGTSLKPEDCLQAVSPRLTSCLQRSSPLDCRFIEGEFLSACLTRAQVSENFCKGIPLEKDEEGTLRWAQSNCQGMGTVGLESCRRVLYAAQHPCDIRFPERHHGPL
jgi:hypothetical protein